MKKLFIGVCLLVLGPLSHAAMGLTVINNADNKAPITLFYPSSSPESSVQRAVFQIQAAWQGQPVLGNRRLIVFSHGSGGPPWPQDLAQSVTPMLVDPPNFNRAELPVVYAQMSAFFTTQLLVGQ